MNFKKGDKVYIFKKGNWLHGAEHYKNKALKTKEIGIVMKPCAVGCLSNCIKVMFKSHNNNGTGSSIPIDCLKKVNQVVVVIKR